MKEMCFAVDCEGEWYLIPLESYTWFKYNSEDFSKTGDYTFMDNWQKYMIDSPDGVPFYV